MTSVMSSVLPLGRRGLLRAASAAALAATAFTLAAPASHASARPSGVRVRLPAPTGPHPIGTVPLHLVDRSRPDPWVGSVAYRELMVSVWYPARAGGGRYRLAPYMEAGAAAAWDAVAPHGIPSGTVDWAAVRTHERVGAPVEGGRRPVVLY